VCEAELDTLQSLVDKSLLRRWGTGRLGMLETIHEFARERLSPEELEHIGRRHAEHFLEVALSGNFTADARGEQDSELGRLELPNFRAAFTWALEHGKTELALRIAVALEGFLEQTAPFEAIAQFELCSHGPTRSTPSCGPPLSALTAEPCTSRASSSEGRPGTRRASISTARWVTSGERRT
jgi:hypothetical protein